MNGMSSSSTTVACPIVYGNIAFSLGKKADETATHKWTLFIRGPNDEDLSAFVSKVAFSLHPSFAHPVREVFSSPFEITETGWGEFEAGIRIFFKDVAEQPLDITHAIKLYHSAAGHGHLPSKQPVMSEVYDEVVFTDPSEEFLRQLMMYTKPSVRKITDMTEHYTVFSDQEDLRVLALIHAHLRSGIEAAKVKLLRIEGDLAIAAQSASMPLSAASLVSPHMPGAGAAQSGSGPGRKRQSNAASNNTGISKAARTAVSTADRQKSRSKNISANSKKGATSKKSGGVKVEEPSSVPQPKDAV